jgi:hypothetical protein
MALLATLNDNKLSSLEKMFRVTFLTPIIVKNIKIIIMIVAAKNGLR